ncbi:MAG TPA: hypothetical protein VLZ30_08300 [Verrucomicrobiae bacterium]|nr:hypothetical protein [Verrucomicrobiae bacterium]
MYRRQEQHIRQGRPTQWYLRTGFVEQSRLLDPRPAELDKLEPPSGCSWMDPFVWKQGADYFIFMEERPFDRPHAHISVLQLDKDGRRKSDPRVVLARDYHLAYPFLFAFEGELYMMPDSNANRTVDVYRCESFPDRWAKSHTLFRETRAADATLHHHQGQWWIFLTIQRGRYRLNHDLFVLHTDSPLGGVWREHRRRPVLQSFERARPAGRLFELDGRLYRPSQDCLRGYGHSLNINEITRLDGERYAERLVHRVRPDWETGTIGNHHVDWNEGLMVMDVLRLGSTDNGQKR